MDKWILKLYAEGSTRVYKSTGKKFNKAYYPFISQFANLILEQAKSNKEVAKRLNDNPEWKKFEDGFLKKRIKEESSQLAGGRVEDQSSVSSKITPKFDPDNDIMCGGSRRSFESGKNENEKFIDGGLVSTESYIVIERTTKPKRGEQRNTEGQSACENVNSPMEDVNSKIVDENAKYKYAENKQKPSFVLEEVTERLVDSNVEIPKGSKAKGIMFEDTEENVVEHNVSSTIAVSGSNAHYLDGEENIADSRINLNQKQESTVLKQVDGMTNSQVHKSKEEDKERAEENVKDSMGPFFDLRHVQKKITTAGKKESQQVAEEKKDSVITIGDFDTDEATAGKVKNMKCSSNNKIFNSKGVNTKKPDYGEVKRTTEVHKARKEPVREKVTEKKP